MTTRPPVVTIMGHVDHGKTSLLDYIRKAKVAASEAGGITQHIGAYQAEHQGKKITFLDTPGHAAFSKMRSRGAAVTDIVVLVVAADDGVKPQTIESIAHIKASNVPLIVAITKSDLPTASSDMVKAQLTEHDIKVTGFGGDVDVVEVSSKTGKGIDDLLETILVTAELQEIQADLSAPLEAVVIESVKDRAAGVLVTALVKNGTLKAKDELYTQTVVGKVKRMNDSAGRVVEVATPGMPVVIMGFDELPNVGEAISTLLPDKQVLEATAQVSVLPDIDYTSLLAGPKDKVKIILKSDTVGTLQALLQQITSDEVDILSSEVGAISQKDIELAAASGGRVIGFHVLYSKQLQQLAADLGVRVKIYTIIYELLESVQKQVLKLIEPTIDEKVTGEAKIVQIFEMRNEKIAGSKVSSGEIKKGDLIHIKREDKIVGDPKIKTMQHNKDQVEKVKTGDECGIVFTRYKNFQVGDTVVAYVILDD